MLPDGSTVVAFGPGGTPGTATLANLARLPALAPGLSLASPLTLPPQTLLEYQWTGSEPLGEYLLFAAAVRAGGLADGVLGPADLLALATGTLRFEAGGAEETGTPSPTPGASTPAANVLTFAPGPGPLDLRRRARRSGSWRSPRPWAAWSPASRSWPASRPLNSLVAGLGDLGREPAGGGRRPGRPQAPRRPGRAPGGGRTAEPQNPAHLVNAAGLASLLGFPSEALGLLAAADLLGPDAYSPLGIPGRALAQNNRGHALLGLGRFAEAAGALDEAVDLAPQLSEARTNLSLAQLCQGNEERAVRLSRAGRWRTLAGRSSRPSPSLLRPAPPAPTRS